MDLSIVGTVVSIAGGLGLLTGAFRGARRFFRFQDRLEETLKPGPDGKSISEQVAEIRKEIHPNGGTSLRDAVERAAQLAAEAHSAASLAAEKAARSELVGNFERADIRAKLNTTETKMDDYGSAMTTHLADAARQTQEVTDRLQKIEQRSA